MKQIQLWGPAYKLQITQPETRIDTVSIGYWNVTGMSLLSQYAFSGNLR